MNVYKKKPGRAEKKNRQTHNHSWKLKYPYLKNSKDKLQAKEMAQWLTACSAVTESLHSTANTYMRPLQLTVTTQLQEVNASGSSEFCTAHMYTLYS